MLFRALAVCVLLAGPAGLGFAQIPSFDQDGISGRPYPGPSSSMSQGAWNSSTRSTGSIIGAVKTADRQPANNVRVELRDMNTGVILGSSYTGSSGSFEFHQVQQGLYELVATSGLSQVEERIHISSMSTSVELQLPMKSAPHDGIQGKSVSVNTYRVPEAARAELLKAQQAAAHSKEEEVVKHLDRALGIAPAYAGALTMRAALKLDRQDVSGALEDAQKAISSDASFALAYGVMGSALNMQMKFDEALRCLQRAEALSPELWQTYFEMGRAFAGKGDYENSVKALDRAQGLAPPYFTLLHVIHARSLMGLGRIREAAAELQGFLTKNPNSKASEEARKMLAQAQAALGSGN